MSWWYNNEAAVASTYTLAPADLRHVHRLDTGVVVPGSGTIHVLVAADLHHAHILDLAAFVSPALSTGKVTISNLVVEVIWGTLRIEDAIGERSTCSFQVRDLSASRDFREGEPVVVSDLAANRIFGGVVHSVDLWNPAETSIRMHSVRCVDNHWYADKRLVVASFEDMRAGEIVRQLVRDYLEPEGVYLADGVIEDGPLVMEAVFNYLTTAQALDVLHEHAGFWWRIDHNRRIHFHAPASMAAPWTLTAPDCMANTIRLNHGNPKYRNKQYVRGAKDLTDTQVETRVGDGVTNAFTMSFPIGKEPSVKVSGVPKTVGIKGLETGFAFYWSKGDPVIAQDFGATPLSPADEFEATYQGEYKIVVVSQDAAQIVERQTLESLGTGIVEAVEDEPQTTTRGAAVDRAGAKLAEFATRGKTLTFTTRRTGLLPGQLLTVDLPVLGLTSQTFLIRAVATERALGV